MATTFFSVSKRNLNGLPLHEPLVAEPGVSCETSTAFGSSREEANL